MIVRYLAVADRLAVSSNLAHPSDYLAAYGLPTAARSLSLSLTPILRIRCSTHHRHYASLSRWSNYNTLGPGIWDRQVSQIKITSGSRRYYCHTRKHRNSSNDWSYSIVSYTLNQVSISIYKRLQCSVECVISLERDSRIHNDIGNNTHVTNWLCRHREHDSYVLSVAGLTTTIYSIHRN